MRERFKERDAVAVQKRRQLVEEGERKAEEEARRKAEQEEQHRVKRDAILARASAKRKQEQQQRSGRRGQGQGSSLLHSGPSTHSSAYSVSPHSQSTLLSVREEEDDVAVPQGARG